MPSEIRAFGTTDAAEFTLALEADVHGDLPLPTLVRSLWFDRDHVSGHWLVWVDANAEDQQETMELGAIVVDDPTVNAFLDELGRLLSTPEHFADEPHFSGAHHSRTSPQQE